MCTSHAQVMTMMTTTFLSVGEAVGRHPPPHQLRPVTPETTSLKSPRRKVAIVREKAKAVSMLSKTIP